MNVHGVLRRLDVSADQIAEIIVGQVRPSVIQIEDLVARKIPPPEPGAAFTVEPLAPRQWYHVYRTETHPNTALTFNEGWGQTRFAPIRQDDGSQVRTYHAAGTVRCAMLESVLHDVPLNPPGFFPGGSPAALSSGDAGHGR